MLRGQTEHPVILFAGTPPRDDMVEMNGHARKVVLLHQSIRRALRCKGSGSRKPAALSCHRSLRPRLRVALADGGQM